MSKNFVSVPLTHNIYYKLPEGIKTLEDDRIEWFEFKYYLTLKLKDNDEKIEIEPCCEDEEGSYYEEDKVEYVDKEEVPYYESEDEENVIEDYNECIFKLAINKLKRNKIVNDGFLLKVSIMKCGMF